MTRWLVIALIATLAAPGCATRAFAGGPAREFLDIEAASHLAPALDRLVDGAVRAARDASSTREKLRAVHVHLMAQDLWQKRGHGSLAGVLAGTEGLTCLTAALLYLEVADRLGWKLALLEQPGHVYLQYGEGADAGFWEARGGYGRRPRAPQGPWHHPLDAGSLTGMLLNARAMHLAETGDMAEAESLLRRAAVLHPDAPYVSNNLAWLLLTRNPDRAAEALELSAHALANDGGNNALATHACALAATGDAAGAAAAMRKRAGAERMTLTRDRWLARAEAVEGGGPCEPEPAPEPY